MEAFKASSLVGVMGCGLEYCKTVSFDEDRQARMLSVLTMSNSLEKR